MTVYGIGNCDTIRRARRWLAERGVGHAFHDYRRSGADPARLARWSRLMGWEALLNRTGTTFRNLPQDERAALDCSRALALLAAHPSCIRRPVVEHPGGLLLGFDAAHWAETFA